jgi:hypothetical protein
MRFAQSHLIFKALCALDEAVEESRQQPVKPSYALRFALAYLYSVSEKDERSVFDAFWRTIQGAETFGLPHDHAYTRGTYACTYFQGICRSVGVEYTVAYQLKLRDARRVRKRGLT